MNLNQFEFDEKELLEEYQRNLINEMKQNHLTVDEICESFIKNYNLESVQTFGGNKNITITTLSQIKLQLFKLICGEEYAEERERIYQSKTNKIFTTAISGKVALTVSIDATLIYPIVVLLLPTIRQIGCESYKNTVLVLNTD